MSDFTPLPPPPPEDDDQPVIPIRKRSRPRSEAGQKGFTEMGPAVGWVQRFGATLLDGAVWLIPNFVVDELGGRTAGVVFTTVAFALYVTILLARNGQTLGDLAVGARVCMAGGQPIPLPRSFLRWGVQFVLASPVLLASLAPVAVPGLIVPFLIDILWPLWERRNRTLHDIVAGTVVVYTQ